YLKNPPGHSAMVAGLGVDISVKVNREYKRAAVAISPRSGSLPQAAAAAARWRGGRPFDGRPGASRLFGGRCRAKCPRCVSPTGKQWMEANIGNALAGRDIARHLRELGEIARGPAPLAKQDRSWFLSALDTAVQAALREASRG